VAQGWNDVDFHGSAQIPTPHLSALARSGVTLNNYYVQPVCSPTRSSLLTGRHVIHSGIYDPDCDHGTTFAVPLNFTMLPVPLAKLGYESHAIGKWHLGLFSRRVVPTGKGFATFQGYYGGAEDYFTHQNSGANDMHFDIGSSLKADTSNVGEYSTFIYAKRAIDLINSFADRKKAAAAAAVAAAAAGVASVGASGAASGAALGADEGVSSTSTPSTSPATPVLASSTTAPASSLFMYLAFQGETLHLTLIPLYS